jgi:outer membrane protein TolC
MKSMRAAIVAGALAILAVAPRGHAATLDLGETLRQVADASPMLAARVAMVEAARQRASAAGAWPSPMLEAGVVNVPTSGRLDADPMTMKTLGVVQTVPVFGARGLARRAGEAAVTVERAGADLTRLETLGMAWRMYCDAYYAGELVKLVLRHRDIAERAVQSARVRYQSGRGT